MEEVKGTAAGGAIYTVDKIRFAKGENKKEDRSTLLFNQRVTLKGIPLQAYEYVVNGRSPIEWVMERYQLSQDKTSGVVNNPNDWLTEQGDARYIIDLIKRLVRVSLDTLEIVQSLPEFS
jgi:predicted helicase